MTTLEVALIGVSVTETAVSAWLYKRLRMKLELERKAYETKRLELERIIDTMPILRNVL
jgi:hypothetical protein